MSTLADIADLLKAVRFAAALTQSEFARRANVSRTTVVRMETVAKGDMSVSVLVRLLEGAGYDLKAVPRPAVRTLEDVLAEQRSGEFAPVTGHSELLARPSSRKPKTRRKRPTSRQSS